MKQLQRPLITGLIGFILGVASLWSVERIWARFHPPREGLPAYGLQQTPGSFFDRFNREDLEGHGGDPFEEMRRMQQQLLEQMENPGATAGVAEPEIETREDDKYVYYEISAKNVDQKKLDVNVEDGQVVISGEVEQKTQDESSVFKSSFHRTFPAPPNTDPNKVKIESAGEKIVIKFPKIA